jgi:hypothetical protein
MVFGDYFRVVKHETPFQGLRPAGMLADNGNAFAAFFHIDTVFDSLHGEIDIFTGDRVVFGHLSAP